MGAQAGELSGSSHSLEFLALIFSCFCVSRGCLQPTPPPPLFFSGTVTSIPALVARPGPRGCSLGGDLGLEEQNVPTWILEIWQLISPFYRRVN